MAQTLATPQTVTVFKERAARADWTAARAVLDRKGGEPPREGDELP